MSNPLVDDAPLPLVVRTTAIDDPGPLLRLLPRADAMAWVHAGDGMVAWGRATGVATSGPSRFADAESWWDTLASTSVVRDEVERTGTGLVAFGSFAFADDPGTSTLTVPEVVVGRRDGISWATTIGHAISAQPELVQTDEPHAPETVSFTDGTLSATAWESVVASAIERINAGQLDKVVLARDMYAHLDSPLDVRWPLAWLAESYPRCWTFSVGDFFGSTPEMLVRRERGLVASRVLAGTIRRTGDDKHDLALAASLARSSKDREEHEYAVRSVVDALEVHCTGMNVPDSPYVLHLPNVMHLATDVTGVIGDGVTALTLAAALHPSAAVGGTPTPEAVELITATEELDRGPYAGPVGWIDAGGDGEWGIGLRSAQVMDTRVRMFAGCGIVADSHPESELAESNAKFIPVRESLHPAS